MKENLMFGCLGNGITVADRNRHQHGDYATVAHIAENGLVRIYCQFLSREALDSINSMACKQAYKYMEQWKSWSEYRRVEEMDNDLPYDGFMSVVKQHNLFTMPAEESLALYKDMKVATSMYELPTEGKKVQ